MTELFHKHRLIFKYIATGVSASFLDLALLFVFKEYFGLWYLTSAIVALSISFTVAFVVQKYWTFGDFSDKNIHGQFFWYFFTVVSSIALNLTILSALVEFSNINYILAQAMSLCIVGVIGFIMNVRNVFHDTAERMGLVFAAGIFPPDIGGPATFVKNLCEKLSTEDIDLSVVTYSDGVKINEGKTDYPVVRVSRAIPFGLRHLVYLFWLFLETINHDLIYAQDVTAAGAPAMIVTKILGKKMIIRIGGDLLWERFAESGRTTLSMDEFYKSGAHKGSLLFILGKRVFARCEKVFVTAENLKRVYTRYYGVNEQRIEVLHNPIPVFDKELVARSVDRAVAGEKIILYAGRFIKYKNVDKLISSFLAIYKEIKPARLIIVGDGPENDRLRAMIGGQAAGHVEIHSKMSHVELMKYLIGADLCVSAATTEYNPNFILEALAFGKRVLLNEDNGLTVKLPPEFLFKDEVEFRIKMKKLARDDIDAPLVRDEVLRLSGTNSWATIKDRHMKLFRALKIF